MGPTDTLTLSESSQQRIKLGAHETKIGTGEKVGATDMAKPNHRG